MQRPRAFSGLALTTWRCAPRALCHSSPHVVPHGVTWSYTGVSSRRTPHYRLDAVPEEGLGLLSMGAWGRAGVLACAARPTLGGLWPMVRRKAVSSATRLC
eukprot:2414352-Prymnesium_polylepis.1